MARLANALLRDFPHYYPVFSVAELQLPGPAAARTTIACWQLCRRRRPEDRLHQRLGLQSRDVGGARQPPPDRRGDGRQQRLPARPADGRADGSRLRHRPGAEHLRRGPRRVCRSSARYSRREFVPARASSAGRQAVEPAPPKTLHPPAPSLALRRPCRRQPAPGSWVIQVGSFADSRAGAGALERAHAAPCPIDPLARRGDRRRGAGWRRRPSTARG